MPAFVGICKSGSIETSREWVRGEFASSSEKSSFDILECPDVNVVIGYRRPPHWTDEGQAGWSQSGRTGAVVVGQLAVPGENAETLAEDYEHRRTKAFSEAIGPFVAIMVNPADRRLSLIRSSCGQRPLYYARIRDGLVFASEASVLLNHPEFNFSPDMDGIAEYLAF